MAENYVDSLENFLLKVRESKINQEPEPQYTKHVILFITD